MAAEMRARRQATTVLHKKKTRNQSRSNTKAVKAIQLVQEAIESDEMRIDNELIIHPSMPAIEENVKDKMKEKRS